LNSDGFQGHPELLQKILVYFLLTSSDWDSIYSYGPKVLSVLLLDQSKIETLKAPITFAVLNLYPFTGKISKRVFSVSSVFYRKK
jgi:hypothetical protein